MYFFTADEHYGHTNVVEYCNRPFKSLDEMHEELIRRHNEVVRKGDIVVHCGDFSFRSAKETEWYISRLNGDHRFLEGSHDRWMGKLKHLNSGQVWQRNVQGQYIVACHWALRTWEKSCYNSWHVYGHSHGGLPPIGKSWDVGVDNNNFYPVSFDDLMKIMGCRPDNVNLLDKKERA